MPAKKKVAPKRATPRAKKTTKRKAAKKKVGRKTGHPLHKSDRNLKTEITPIDGRTVLDQLSVIGSQA